MQLVVALTYLEQLATVIPQELRKAVLSLCRPQSHQIFVVFKVGFLPEADKALFVVKPSSQRISDPNRWARKLQHLALCG